MMERLSIHGQTRIRKLNPSGGLIRIEGLLNGSHGRVDQGQEGTERGRQDGSKSSWRIFSAVFKMLLMFSLLKIINLALVGVPSRRPVIRETLLRSLPESAAVFRRRSFKKYQDVECTRVKEFV